MKCPGCGVECAPKQKYCGACGRQLKKECPGCGAGNPPDHAFCGQCGYNLVNVGICVLNRAGIIKNVNPLFLGLLDQRRDAVLDKPFSLLVYKKDLAPFFTHWNDLISRSQPQSQEIKLKHRDDRPVHVQIEYDFDLNSPEDARLISMTVTDLSDRQLASDQLQLKDNLINLIFGITRDITHLSPPYPEKLISETLKQICTFIGAHSCFLCAINDSTTKLETLHHWGIPEKADPDWKNKTIPFSLINRTLSKLRREKALIIRDVHKLPSGDRNELYAWHNPGLSSLLCHLVYQQERAVGIIGAANMDTCCDWPQNTIELLHLAGHILNDVLPRHKPEPESFPLNAMGPAAVTALAPVKPVTPAGNGEDIEFSFSITDEPSNPPTTPARKPTALRFERDDSTDESKFEKVTPRKDGLIKLICPSCGVPENIPPDPFDQLGYKLLACCGCGHSFPIMRERRWYYRKKMHTPGSFQVPKQKQLNKYVLWESMTVLNLSKSGICFSVDQDNQIAPGDELRVKFQLDNSNKTIIDKSVVVKNIQGRKISCCFQSSDPCDTALGFYLL